ncbi:MAG TPA: glycine zipper 2TM domain-containing protein [Noviherbaspirillum sp.]|nr:glycine zipper 2TM domain-containing protein [Noviherbaspirillum sp.]
MWNRQFKGAVIGVCILGLAACAAPQQSAQQGVPAAGATTSATGYGVVQAIDIVPREQTGTGVGTVAGAVVGGALGSQVGGGSGRTAATIAGAAGGALAGGALTRGTHPGHVYRVAILMDNGSVQTMVQETPPGLQVGERVRLSNGVVVERYR